MFQCLTCIVLLAAAEPISSGTLIQRLPEDGAWVSFHMNEVFDDGTNRTMKILLKSVGKSTVDRQPCRWIELEFQPEMPPEKKSFTYKFLIPEKQFEAGGDPLGHVKEGWRTTADEAPAKFSFEDIQRARPRLDNWLPPVIEKVQRTTERKMIDWQQGRLECDVHTGSHSRKYNYGTVDVSYRLSMNDHVPFGVAAATLELYEDVNNSTNDDAKGTIEFTMIDMGKDAVSKVKTLP